MKQKNFLEENLTLKKLILMNIIIVIGEYILSQGFKKSLIVSYDGIGEIHSALFAVGNKSRIKIIHQENKYPNSLGLIYTAITFYLGWKFFVMKELLWD